MLVPRVLKSVVYGYLLFGVCRFRPVNTPLLITITARGELSGSIRVKIRMMRV